MYSVRAWDREARDSLKRSQDRRRLHRSRKQQAQIGFAAGVMVAIAVVVVMLILNWPAW